MVETVAGFEAIDEIASVEGLDAVFIGPSDLSLSFGHEATLAEPAAEVMDAIGRVADTCANAGIGAGIFTASGPQALRWRERGFNLISVHSDRLLMAERAQQLLAEIRTGVS